jgi:copper chaperone NosL
MDLAAEATSTDAVIFVADHATRDWLRAEQAIFTEVRSLQTPMSSGIIAHGNADTRDRDPAARGGHPLDLSQVLGRTRP